MIKLKDICPRGHQMELKITEVREDESNPTSGIKCWLLFGQCDKCKTLFMQDVFKEKISPTEGIDYKIIHKKISQSTLTDNKYETK